MKGLYALEEYYVRDLQAYYAALAVGPSHNYYRGRAEAAITDWVAYFIEGMAISFESMREQAKRESGSGGRDQSRLLRNLNPRQRKVLALFQESREVTRRRLPLYSASNSGLRRRCASVGWMTAFS